MAQAESDDKHTDATQIDATQTEAPATGDTEAGDTDVDETRADETSADGARTGDAQAAAPEGESPARGRGARVRALLSPTWVRAVLAAAAMLVVLAMIFASTYMLSHKNDDRDVQAQRNEYVQAAKQVMLNFTTLRSSSALADVNNLMSVASGDFRRDLGDDPNAFATVLQKIDVDAHGEIIAAALESMHGDSASVLVVAKMMRSNAQQKEPQLITMRNRISLIKKDGKITATNLDFVP